MKEKQKVPVTKSDTTPFYEQCTGGLRALQTFIREKLEPDVFKSSLAFIEAATLYEHEKKLKEFISTIDKACKDFSKLYKQKNKANTYTDLDITYECRLEDIIPVFNQMKKEIVCVFNHNVEMMKQIEAVKITRKPNIYPLSFMPTFELMIGQGLSLGESKLDELVSAINQGYDLEEATYKKMQQLYLQGLEHDIVRREQMEVWKKEPKLTNAEKIQLKKLDNMVLYLHQLNIDILMSIRIMRFDMVPRIAKMKRLIDEMEDLLFDLEKYENGSW